MDEFNLVLSGILLSAPKKWSIEIKGDLNNSFLSILAPFLVNVTIPHQEDLQ